MRAWLLAIMMIAASAARADDAALRKQVVGLWTLTTTADVCELNSGMTLVTGGASGAGAMYCEDT